MVADQIGAAIGVVAMVFPLLDAQHAFGGLGHQRGVFAQQIGAVNLELCAQPLHHEPDEALCDRCQAPVVPCEEPLPATEIALVEEGAAGEARQTFAPLDHHEGPQIALKVSKAGGREAGGKDVQ